MKISQGEKRGFILKKIGNKRLLLAQVKLPLLMNICRVTNVIHKTLGRKRTIPEPRISESLQIAQVLPESAERPNSTQLAVRMINL